jgi:hypothetical protein
MWPPDPFYHCPFVTKGTRSSDGNSPRPSSPSVIYWINQSKAYNSMLFCDWLTILRLYWRQVAVHCSAYSWTVYTECTSKHLGQAKCEHTDSTNAQYTTSMYEKSTTHVNRTYSRTYWFIYIDSRTDILYYYTQLVLMKCTSVYTTHINGIRTHM